MPCYPCHIIALAEYLAHLECATLLQSSPSPCLLPSLFRLVAASRWRLLLCTLRFSACGVAKDNAPPQRGGGSAGGGAATAAAALVPLTRVCAQVAKGPRQENQAVQHLFFPFGEKGDYNYFWKFTCTWWMSSFLFNFVMIKNQLLIWLIIYDNIIILFFFF